MTRRIGLLLAVVALGCASQRGASRGPRYCVERRATGDAAQPAPPPASAQQVTATSVESTELLGRDEDEAPRCIDPSARITALEGELAQGMAAFADAVSDCRSACRAAAGICAAAAEICRLTGDSEAASALDARCTRARAACDDSTRQRAERCPVCPAE